MITDQKTSNSFTCALRKKSLLPKGLTNSICAPRAVGPGQRVLEIGFAKGASGATFHDFFQLKHIYFSHEPGNCGGGLC